MIVPGYSEEQVLNELLDDYPSIRRKFKKMADKEIDKMRKQGKCAESKLFDSYIRSKNGNKWYVIISCKPSPKGQKSWSCRCHCVVELENGRREIYFLRGLRFGPPYFVQMNNHVLRRMRERFCPKEGKTVDVTPNSQIAKIAFHISEQPIFKRLAAPDMAALLEQCTDVENVSGLIVMRAAMFIAYRTESGNYICKTFMNVDERFMKSKKAPIFHLLQACHAYMNPKEMADFGPPINKSLAHYLQAACIMCPEAESYLATIDKGMYVLYL